MWVSFLWETYSGFLRVRVLVTEGYKLQCGPILEGQMHQGKILGAGRHFKHRQQHMQRGRAWNNSLHGETFLIGPTRSRSSFILPLCLVSSHIPPLKHLWCVCGGVPQDGRWVLGYSQNTSTPPAKNPDASGRQWEANALNVSTVSLSLTALVLCAYITSEHCFM